jgi:hypothetical protein
MASLRGKVVFGSATHLIDNVNGTVNALKRLVWDTD